MLDGIVKGLMIWWAGDLVSSITEERRTKSRIMTEEHNRKYRVADHEIPRFLCWAIGEEGIQEVEKHGELTTLSNDVCRDLVLYFNKKHKNTLYLSLGSDFQSNYNSMLNLWIHLGKP